MGRGREEGKRGAMNTAVGANGCMHPLPGQHAALSKPGTEQDMGGPSPALTRQYSSDEQGHWATDCWGLLPPCPLAQQKHALLPAARGWFAVLDSSGLLCSEESHCQGAATVSGSGQQEYFLNACFCWGLLRYS